MSSDIKVDEETQRPLRRLEHRCHSAQTAPAEARTSNASLQETRAATEPQRHEALRGFQSATQHLLEIQQAIARLED